MIKPRMLVLVLLSSLITACGSQAIFEDQVDLPEGIWSESEPVRFTFQITDAYKPYSLNLHLRNSLDYTYHNIYFKYYLRNAQGEVLQESLEERLLFEVASGSPLGDGLGSVKEISYMIGEPYHFIDTGQYELSIEQYMRIAELSGILSVGASVVPITQE